MINLLQRYPVSQILIFIVLLALAIKGVISFIDWANEKIKKAFNKQYKKIDDKKAVEEKIEQDRQLILFLQKQQQETEKGIKNLAEKINILIASDRDDIRSYITHEHHYFCYQKKWIDDFSLDCIEKQYAHYVDEGGNSFIKTFMEQLRALPKQDPNTIN